MLAAHTQLSPAELFCSQYSETHERVFFFLTPNTWYLLQTSFSNSLDTNWSRIQFNSGTNYPEVMQTTQVKSHKTASYFRSSHKLQAFCTSERLTINPGFPGPSLGLDNLLEWLTEVRKTLYYYLCVTKDTSLREEMHR